MIKYLICESKARAMGISRETYIGFVESMGVNYVTAEQPIDAYGIMEHPTDSRCLLIVDDTKPYYSGLPQVHKDRLVGVDEVVLEGWVLSTSEPA